MGSSRFPGKTLADIAGRPMLSRLVERLRASPHVERVVLATTVLPEDDALEAWCAAEAVSCYRGSANDVLGRLAGAADRFACDPVIEVLGDNPLVHSALVDGCVRIYDRGGVDYVATVTTEYPKAEASLMRFPVGVRVQVIARAALIKCAELALTAQFREHATSYIAAHPEIFRTAFLEAAGEFADCHRPDLTFAVNHRENLDLIRGLFARCFSNNANFSVGDAIRAFDGAPDLRRLMGEPARV